MSQQPPYGGPPPYQPPVPPAAYQPRPRKPRPSGWWFVVGSVLIVAAVGVAIGLFVWTLSAFLSTDAEISADGQTYHVRVGSDGERMLWLEDGSAQHCQVVDRATAEDIELDLVGESYDRSDEGGEWHGVAKFDPGSGDLDVTCDGNGGTALIGPAPRIGSFVLGILATILIPLALGLSGLSILIVTGILFATRPAAPGKRES